MAAAPGPGAKADEPSSRETTEKQVGKRREKVFKNIKETV
jgi:hypothetical protein